MKYKNREDYDKNAIYHDKSICPFCIKLEKNNIIFESDFWFVMPNANPYFEDKNQLMAIPKRHLEFTTNLKKEELIDFQEIEKFMKNYYKDKWEYFSFIRQSKSNKSVEHMHYHYVLWIPHARVIDWENYFWTENGYFKN